MLDAAIPGVMGLVLLLWPQAMFIGSKVTPDPRRIRTLRILGTVLLAVAVVYVAVDLVGK